MIKTRAAIQLAVHEQPVVDEIELTRTQTGSPVTWRTATRSWFAFNWEPRV